MNFNCASNSHATQVEAGTLEMTDRHPCYSFKAHRTYARMHLPVAPRCNISCNYCNRKYDCVNESRPGVTSEVLTPEAARDKYLLVRDKVANLSVVGIAGPGDALANWGSVSRTIKLIKEVDREVIFCLSTNGLRLPDYAREIVQLGVKHVTVTVNCIEPDTGSLIYKHVNYQGRVYRGAAGAAILLQNQQKGIEFLARQGVLVKINIVMVKGINDERIPEVVRLVKGLGAFITNIMPLVPAPGSAFENFAPTDVAELNRMRDICGQDMRQMRHCKQCRADAIGLLDEDRSREFSTAGKKLNTNCGGCGQEQKVAMGGVR
ncbi:nitrogen fixation protein NifB [Desulfotomaculum arcticum]|uniref:FeMo cofactor biosynthesis protein NifB n=1 Tax=Desulfotruncus arcticus DSM 17038 TaxID=1121424 RepID=A0A1I2Q420_9FIRM|nr:nitrogen fixation protein NifB [Desulfotomaculum arcticum] [Desulfotruncus arcticus DSM 17038]